MVRRVSAAVFGVAITACKFPPPPDVDPDAAIDATDAMPCEGELYGFAVSNLAPCDVPRATNALDLTDVVSMDTTSGTMTTRGSTTVPIPGSQLLNQMNGTMVRVVSATALTIPATETIRVSGTYPIAFLVRGDASIAGTLGANAVGANPIPSPAGANSTCGAGSGSVGTGPGGAPGSGGGGGAYAGGGGMGGDSGTFGGGAKGTPLSMLQRSPLRGGCPGSQGSGNASAGGGGGAIQITSSATVTLDGVVSVSGGGGGSVANSGGGAGGSGGMILIEAAVRIQGTGYLTSNGGGGGGGACGGSISTGLDGGTMTSVIAAGGGGCHVGGNGGAGAVPDGTDGGDGPANEGGGGGGGGVGPIWIRSAQITFFGLSSPPARIEAL